MQFLTLNVLAPYTYFGRRAWTWIERDVIAVMFQEMYWRAGVFVSLTSLFSSFQNYPDPYTLNRLPLL